MPEAQTIQSTAVVTATTSKQWTLNLKDLAKGGLVAAFSSVIMFLYSWSTSDLGLSDIDWQGMIKTTIAAFLAYMIKNLIEPAKTIVTIQPPEGQMGIKEAIKIKDAVNIEQAKQEDKGDGKTE